MQKWTPVLYSTLFSICAIQVKCRLAPLRCKIVPLPHMGMQNLWDFCLNSINYRKFMDVCPYQIGGLLNDGVPQHGTMVMHKLNFLFGPAQNESGVLSMWECYTRLSKSYLTGEKRNDAFNWVFGIQNSLLMPYNFSRK